MSVEQDQYNCLGINIKIIQVFLCEPIIYVKPYECGLRGWLQKSKIL